MNNKLGINQQDDPIANWLANGFIVIIVCAILYGVAFVVSVPIALHAEKVHVQEFALVNDKLTLISDASYIDEDWLFGLPASVNRLLGTQVDRRYVTKNGTQLDLNEYQPRHTLVVNNVSRPLYNTYHTYGEVALLDDAQLVFEVPANTYKVVKYFLANSLGCSNRPPQSSNKPYISWTTLVPSQSCPK